MENISVVAICQNILGFGEGVAIEGQKGRVLGMMYPSCASGYTHPNWCLKTHRAVYPKK